MHAVLRREGETGRVNRAGSGGGGGSGIGTARGGESAGGGRGHALVPLEVDERPLIAVRTGHLEEHDVPGAHHRRGPRRRLRRRGRAGQTAKLEGIVGRHDATREGDRRDATRTHVRRGEKRRAGRACRARGRCAEEGTPARRLGSAVAGGGAAGGPTDRHFVPRKLFPFVQILWTFTVLAPPRERFKRATRRARARGLARRGASPHSARHARGRSEPRAVLDAHRRGRSRLRRDTPPRRRRPRRAPPPLETASRPQGGGAPSRRGGGSPRAHVERGDPREDPRRRDRDRCGVDEDHPRAEKLLRAG